MDEKKNVYLSFHKNFVRQDIEYRDASGEVRKFNSVTLPKGTFIDAVDVSYFQFSPLFVNPSKYYGDDYRDIPVLADREIHLKRSILDENGKPVIGQDGKAERDTVVVTPQQLKDALTKGRERYLDGLKQRAESSRESSKKLDSHSKNNPIHPTR